MSVTSINSEDHFNNLLRSNTYVVVDFYADWCGPCRAIRPMFEKLASANAVSSHLTFVKVNVDEQSSIARKHNVSAMPTFLFFQDRKPYPGRDTIRGADAQSLARVIQDLGRRAKEAQNLENEKAQQAAEQSTANNSADAASNTANKGVEAREPDDGTTVSGGYTLGTDVGKRSDWKMSLRG